MSDNNTSSLRPPPCDGCTIEFPDKHVMLVTIARPKSMNSMTHAMHWQFDALFTWFDEEPAMRVAIITGQGQKAFCAGSDLLEIEMEHKTRREKPGEHKPWEHAHPSNGFAGMSRRKGKKPILAAVNGLALGGGFEIVLNCDIIIASPTASFGLPEPLVGVYAYGGGLPRLVRNIGLPAASDIALTGRRVSAQEALDLRLINGISKSSDSVVAETLEKARQIASIFPEGIIITRAALRETWEASSIERAFQIPHDNLFLKVMDSPNSSEGLAAFREKRKPVWRDSKL